MSSWGPTQVLVGAAWYERNDDTGRWRTVEQPWGGHYYAEHPTTLTLDRIAELEAAIRTHRSRYITYNALNRDIVLWGVLGEDDCCEVPHE